MIKIFLLKKSDKGIIDTATSDDIVGRQTLITKEGSQYGMKDDELLFIIQGSDEAVQTASKIIGKSAKVLDAKKTSKIMQQIKEEEDKADQGMGFLFG